MARLSTDCVSSTCPGPTLRLFAQDSKTTAAAASSPSERRASRDRPVLVEPAQYRSRGPQEASSAYARFTPDLAMSLSTLGNRLSDLGRREEALTAAQEAADLYRVLARSRPEAFTPDLAGSLQHPRQQAVGAWASGGGCCYL